MGLVVHIANHARASAGWRAAKEASACASMPAATAVSVNKTADHHSAGTLLRCHHLETAEAPAPISDAIASREGQSSMMDLKLSVSDMPKSLGHVVPKSKAKMSQDNRTTSRHSVFMVEDLEKIAENKWREGFRDRIKEARGERTQEDMAYLLGITQSAYSKYEGKRMTPIPIRFLPKFCKICAVDLYWLIEGKEVKQKVAAKPPAKVLHNRKTG